MPRPRQYEKKTGRLPLALNEQSQRQRELFVLEYLRDFDASRAATAAGYSPKTGASLLAQQPIKIALRQALDERAKMLKLNANMVINELREVAFATPLELAKWHNAKLADKIKALEDLGKYLRLWDDEDRERRQGAAQSAIEAKILSLVPPEALTEILRQAKEADDAGVIDI